MVVGVAETDIHEQRNATLGGILGMYQSIETAFAVEGGKQQVDAIDLSEPV